MDTKNIMQAELIDIVFDGRNKSYGAYELRTAYNNHMRNALLFTGAFSLVVFLSSSLSNHFRPKATVCYFTPVTLIDPHYADPEKEKPQPEAKKKVDKPIETKAYLKPQVVPNDQVKEDQKPSAMDELVDAAIGTENIKGEKDNGIHPPAENNVTASTGVGEEEEEKTFLIVEHEAEFPGGLAGWTRYVSREVERNIDVLQDEGKSGTVVVIFVVDKEGNVSDVHALNCSETGLPQCLGPDSQLANMAVAAIKRGPKWKPANQNGHPVKAYRRQPVTFRVE